MCDGVTNRTTEYWTHQAVAEVERRQAEQKEKAEKAEKEGEEGAGGGGEMGGVLQYADEAGMREKEYRRLAFSLATQRFDEVRRGRGVVVGVGVDAGGVGWGRGGGVEIRPVLEKKGLSGD